MNISAILLASGVGKRLHIKTPKAFIKLGGQELYRYSLLKFHKLKDVKTVIMTVPAFFTPSKINRLKHKLLKRYNKLSIIIGGKERFDSMKQAIAHCPSETDLVVIHDCARPLIDSKTIKAAIKKASKFGSCVVGRRLTESIKQTAGDKLTRNLVRDAIFITETPQIFQFKEFSRLLNRFKNKSSEITDDCYIPLLAGKDVRFIESGGLNLKLTSMKDLKVLAALLHK
ncbi:MAG: 2-C-methyl-D-erythritol 4-phosphate cytidylyltransferase [Planctomycetes bacterium]|nr:2-C-methyl-D-erythritol 4-phosphate cytidylyltransferase [Planctomycetota bacterium]